MTKKDFAAMESRRPSGDSAARAALRSRMAHPTSLRLDELQANPLNPRYDEDDPAIKELADTLAHVGQLQPAVIVPREQYLEAYPDQRTKLGPQPWVVIVGNRRLAAARLANRPSFDVRVAADITSAVDVEDRILIENIQRKDLPPLLEAEHLQRRLNRPGQTIRSVGEAIGKSHTYVQQRVDLLGMVPEFQEMLRHGQINIKTGRRLGQLAEADQRDRLNAGPPYDAASAPPAGRVSNGTEHSDGQEPGNLGGSVGQDGAAHAGPTDGNPVSNGRAHTSTPAQSLEEVRLSVSQWLESALAELDRALPADDLGELGRTLVETQRHILAARKALGGRVS